MCHVTNSPDVLTVTSVIRMPDMTLQNTAWYGFEHEQLFLLEYNFRQVGDYVFVIKEDGNFTKVLIAVIRA